MRWTIPFPQTAAHSIRWLWGPSNSTCAIYKGKENCIQFFGIAYFCINNILLHITSSKENFTPFYLINCYDTENFCSKNRYLPFALFLWVHLILFLFSLPSLITRCGKLLFCSTDLLVLGMVPVLQRPPEGKEIFVKLKFMKFKLLIGNFRIFVSGFFTMKKIWSRKNIIKIKLLLKQKWY